ncbi:MAG TPA: hypothetical protein VI636_14375 [Candidatus Angelobacter sp.]
MSNYKKALTDAQREMAEIETKIADLKSRHAQLETTIAGLKGLMGEPQEETDITFSASIRTILMSSVYKDRFINVAEIANNLRILRPQKPVNLASVRTILNRLVQSEEAKQGEAKDGTVGYSWNRSQRTLSDLR